MAVLDLAVTAQAGSRSARARHYVMCRPDHFEVSYAINPWMHPELPVDQGRALAQWEAIRDAYLALGHRVDVVEPVRGLPDMVFAANAAVTVDGRVLLARFRHLERAGEEPAYRAWFAANGFSEIVAPERVNEGEGDIAVVGDVVLAGWGFRTERAAHAEVASALGREVVSVELVDPRFYHLDTALTVLADDDIAWFPAAFSPASQRTIRRLFPHALVADETDALAFGLNATSDGRNVVLSATATSLAARLAARGYEPWPVEVSELLKAGGGAKCCTLEVRPAPQLPAGSEETPW